MPSGESKRDYQLDSPKREKDRELDCEDIIIQAITMLKTALKDWDIYTEVHCERVAELAVKLAKEFGLSQNRIEQLRYAALLHDIGKIALPDSILNKPGRLTAREWEVVKRHPTIGGEIVRKVERLRRVARIIEQNHERVDGQGYPQGLRGEQIELEARILAVVDAYDAMIMNRVYRGALAEEEAIAELKENAGTQFDREVVERFIRILKSIGLANRVRPHC